MSRDSWLSVEAVRPRLEAAKTRLQTKPSVESMITFGVVAGVVLFVFAQLQPSLLFANTTPSGGDTGAHVWGPAYLRDHLLPKGRITGWTPDWYSGFPAFTFYFPLPALVIAFLSFVLPYGIAFKLVTVLGIVSLPVAAWAFGRLSGMRFPGPPVLAVATVPFLFDRSFTIYGGNIPSTLAGEFTFSISLSLAVLFLGVVARGLDTGRHRALAAVLLAMTGLSHLLPTIFAVVGAGVLFLLRPGRRRLGFLAAILGTGALLAAFWSLPFLVRLPYANNMGWEKITEYSKNLFPENIRWVVALAVAGAGLSVLKRSRQGLFLVGMATIAGVLFVVAPPGRLWNARVLPFWYLCLYLLAGVAVSEVGAAIGRVLATYRVGQFLVELLRSGVPPSEAVPEATALAEQAFVDDGGRGVVGIARLATPVGVALAAWMVVGLPLGVLPNWLPKPQTTDVSFIPAWAKWNYSGYERKAAYPEYKAVVDTMAEVGRTHGCGRANWEYESGLDRFGTPMALMLLPFWTDGCIGSMEGLYFESSATVPYHFLSAAELSKAPSNPMRDLPYPTTNVAAGIKHLQILGARYYMAFSPETVAQADVHPDLTKIASTGRWSVYQVRGSDIVEPLQFQPAVATGPVEGETGWLNLGVDWYTDPSAHDVYLAASGPKEWERVEVREEETEVKTVGAATSIDPPARQPLEPVQVTGISSDDNDIRFQVDRVGVPVLVKTSYFPNWKASGAKGPYRVTPNLMVVIPTSNSVKLHYGTTPVDVVGWLLTFGGIALVVLMVRQGPVDFATPRPDDEPELEPRTLDLGGRPGPPAPSSRPPVTVSDRPT